MPSEAASPTDGRPRDDLGDPVDGRAESAGDVQIHPLRERAEHVFTLAAWMQAEWYAASGGALDDAIRTLVSRMNRYSLPCTLVALEGERPVGMVSLIWKKLPGGVASPCLAGLYVVPEWRRRGLGTRLCQEAMARAGRLGVASLALATTNQQRFYHRLGWRESRPPQPDGHPADRTLMNIDLTRGAAAPVTGMFRPL